MSKLFKRACIIPLVSFILFAVISFTSHSQERSIRAKTTIFYKGGALIMERAKVDTKKIYGIKLSPLNTTVTSGKNEVYIPHSVENLSNTSDEITIKITRVVPEGWSAEVWMDNNRDGGHQWWENDRLDKPKKIGEGSVFGFLVKVKRPDNAKPGDKGVVTVKASCMYKDGDCYIGGNGLNYGGEDETTTTDTIIVE